LTQILNKLKLERQIDSVKTAGISEALTTIKKASSSNSASDTSGIKNFADSSTINYVHAQLSKQLASQVSKALNASASKQPSVFLLGSDSLRNKMMIAFLLKESIENFNILDTTCSKKIPAPKKQERSASAVILVAAQAISTGISLLKEFKPNMTFGHANSYSDSLVLFYLIQESKIKFIDPRYAASNNEEILKAYDKINKIESQKNCLNEQLRKLKNSEDSLAIKNTLVRIDDFLNSLGTNQDNRMRKVTEVYRLAYLYSEYSRTPIISIKSKIDFSSYYVEHRIFDNEIILLGSGHVNCLIYDSDGAIRSIAVERFYTPVSIELDGKEFKE